jgi:acyl-CoA thioesterase I
MTDESKPCTTHPEIVAFKYPLPHLAEALKRQRKIKIVTIGSSSTAGALNVVPFPPRLELALRKQFYGRIIDVLNRGLGGQEAPEEISRFECDVIAEAPALVIWQVGSNAVFHNLDHNPQDITAALDAGLGWLAPLQMDVVLMDLQRTTAIVAKDKIDLAIDIENRVLAAAEKAKVNVFKRWALMEQWVKEGMDVDKDLTDPEDTDNHLHMSDWATKCATQALCEAIRDAPQSVV